MKRRKRKPTLAGVARQAAKAGIEVARYDFRPDGTISVVTGKPVARHRHGRHNIPRPERVELRWPTSHWTTSTATATRATARCGINSGARGAGRSC